MKIAVIMTNWNGRALLRVTVPKVKQAIDYDKDNFYEFVIIDDCSTENDIQFINENFEYVKVMKTPKNSGFQGAVNYGVQKVDSHLILIMNNDIYPKEDGIYFLTKHFVANKNKNLFAVTGKFYDWNKNYIYGNRGGKFEKGHIWLYEKEADDTCTQTFFACGGCALWNREKFIKLGGFDLLYYPLYYEEIDISYRALKRGWKIFYEPNAIFYHRVQSTITQQHKRNIIGYISACNNYLFTWRNITDKDLILKHLICCPVLLFRDLFKLKVRFWIAIFRALKKLSIVLRKRNQELKEVKISDKEILNKINNIINI